MGEEFLRRPETSRQGLVCRFSHKDNCFVIVASSPEAELHWATWSGPPGQGASKIGHLWKAYSHTKSETLAGKTVCRPAWWGLFAAGKNGVSEMSCLDWEPLSVFTHIFAQGMALRLYEEDQNYSLFSPQFSFITQYSTRRGDEEVVIRYFPTIGCTLLQFPQTPNALLSLALHCIVCFDRLANVQCAIKFVSRDATWESLFADMQKAVVKRVDNQLGVLLSLPKWGHGYAHISDIADEKVEKLEKVLHVGQTEAARVIGSRLMDGIAVVSLKPSAIEQFLMVGLTDCWKGCREIVSSLLQGYQSHLKWSLLICSDGIIMSFAQGT